jgi:ABC-type transporter Mla subunit MlaD
MAASSNPLVTKYNALFQAYTNITTTLDRHSSQIANAVTQFSDFQSSTRHELDSLRDVVQVSHSTALATQRRLDQVDQMQQTLQQISQYILSQTSTTQRQPISTPSAIINTQQSTLSSDSIHRQPNNHYHESHQRQPNNNYHESYLSNHSDSAPESRRNLSNQSDERE